MDLVEPGELLEETWFFGNSLHGKSRRHSDRPLVADEKSMEETYSSIKKIPELGTRSWSLTRTGGPGLMKTTSMPTNVKESSTRMYSTMNLQQMQYCGHLSRAPSLPTFAEKEEFQDDEESDFCMGKLIRQASLNHARVQSPLPPVKGRLTRSCSISSVPKQRISKITEEGLKLQERDEENVVRRRNCSELAARSSPTPFQNIAKKSSSGQDMKAQIKFWARAVASNVRQEC